MNIVLGILLLVAAVFLVAVVLMQDSHEHGLGGAIAGSSSADTFFGKTKGKTADKMLSRITGIVAVCFCVVVILMYIFQPDTTISVPTNDDGTLSLEVSDGDVVEIGDVENSENAQ